MQNTNQLYITLLDRHRKSITLWQRWSRSGDRENIPCQEIQIDLNIFSAESKPNQHPTTDG